VFTQPYFIKHSLTSCVAYHYLYFKPKIILKHEYDSITSRDNHRSCKEKAVEINTTMNIAVVDAGANLVAFVRMDGAWLGSVDISIKKAKTARFFDMNTREVGKLFQPGGSLYSIEHSNGGLITFPGGIPIKDESGQIIGAIGVSGSMVENDHAVAEAGSKAYQN
jgi:uncharacterized protein GlcG (DUF336 family)